MCRLFLELTPDDLEILKEAEKTVLDLILDLNGQRNLISDFIFFMEKIEVMFLQLETEEKPTIHLVKPLLRNFELELEQMTGTESEGSSTIKALAKAAQIAWNGTTPKFTSDVFDVAYFLNPNELCKIRKSFDRETAKLMAEKFSNFVKEFETPVELDFLPDECEGNEAIRYMRDAPEESVENFDLIDWWKKNEIKYPAVAKLAKRVLSIPASSTSVKSLFTYLTEMLSETRNRLGESTVADFIRYKTILRCQE
uniref:HAT C-terminal dimerisation domain-containing protein n=1 Tax=Panagrolaimus sp. JU765 TaxID=591449 RepID=A0AC34RDL0_9BILA